MPLNEHVYCVAIAFKMTEWVEQWICIKFCIKLEHSSAETILMIQKAFGDDAMDAVQMLVQTRERGLRIGWKWSMFWKACNKQNTFECDWRLTVRTRSWSGDSKNDYVQDFDEGSWPEMCPGKICSVIPTKDLMFPSKNQWRLLLSELLCIPKFKGWNANAHCNSVRRWGLWGGVGHEGRALTNEIDALIKGIKIAPSPLSPREDTRRSWQCAAWKRSSPH